MTADLSQLVKAYDVRGVVPDQWDEPLAELFGAAFVQVTGADAIVIGHDMRPSSPGLSRAFARGAAARGVDVTEIGLCSTDQLYYASGAFTLPGAMFTASHNPARYNGIKMCRAGAAPVGQDTGLSEIRRLAESWLDSGAPAPAPDAKPGTITSRDTLEDYAAYLRSLVDLTSVRPLKVVVDAGNGMGGHTVPTVFAGLPLELVPMYFELDGTFPNHEANPLDPANIVDLQKRVREEGADLGIAFDGDADRCFVVDERGEPVSPSAITALVAARELAKHGGGTVIHNLITSWSVPEVVREHGGTPVRTRVGHSFIKAEMATSGAIFGGEHSAHYYFRDFWNADTGMLAALHVLAALGGQDGPLSGLVAEYDRYAGSGEINSTVDDQAARLAAVRAAYEGREGVTIDELDGLTVTTEDAWFNVRPSNTEPLLRLNAEARDETTMTKVRDEVLAIIRG
ncbi:MULTISPECIES: phosphomannomutase/phosphoglucomutase [unclassified Streptomyces]|uniref:phosphomannomutase/phosphoglucomutase n=1 Tax=unclassified Streptomyces TaxID=2593676 RepID=UPI00225B778C|nr:MULTISPECIES: phosphomannomutase/phosphoglucomutase [unclassified Streptomyces]MCX5132793.1 phosphomannomutase/phosphoglucomutase [Streptomyces sp. NBC_00340]MCX5283727.1 phosphomannomutase/phosphoglucomutase [Streptomyces sp. NBC_00198]WSK62927.1 phosphomannomutase/phosphoglucomutase [Streptomyces sp. NBC_01281]